MLCVKVIAILGPSAFRFRARIAVTEMQTLLWWPHRLCSWKQRERKARADVSELRGANCDRAGITANVY